MPSIDVNPHFAVSDESSTEQAVANSTCFDVQAFGEETHQLTDGPEQSRSVQEALHPGRFCVIVLTEVLLIC